MSHRKTYKKEARIFFAKACAMLESLEAKKLSERPEVPSRWEVNPGGHRYKTMGLRASASYELQTTHGRLEVHVYDDWIPTRFDRRGDVPLPLHACRQTGKWNFYYSFSSYGLDGLDDWLESVWRELEDVLADSPHQRKLREQGVILEKTP